MTQTIVPRLALSSKRNTDYGSTFEGSPKIVRKPLMMIRKKIEKEIKVQSGDVTIRSRRESVNSEIDSYLDSDND